MLYFKLYVSSSSFQAASQSLLLLEDVCIAPFLFAVLFSVTHFAVLVSLSACISAATQPVTIGCTGLTQAEEEAHIALWAVLKSPMLLSCDIASLSPATLALLKNDDMLAILTDPLARQARRLYTSTGSTTPSTLTFETCPGKDQQPLQRQLWKHQAGQIVSQQSGRIVTLFNCGFDDAGRPRPNLILCSDDPKTAQPPGLGCLNKTCPTASTFTFSPVPIDDGNITNAFNGKCVEGMLGPGRSSVVTNQCAENNVKQLWTLHDDGTLRASRKAENATMQCLTAEASTDSSKEKGNIDIFVGPLVNGDATVVFFNRGLQPASATLSLSDLSGWDGVQVAIVKNVWKGSSSKNIARVESGMIESHGVSFLLLKKSK